MHDLPPSPPTPLLSNPARPQASSFSWWKTSVVVVIGLTIVVSWMGTERTLVRPASQQRTVKQVNYAPQEMRRLAQQYVSNPQSLSDEEYRAAALAREAEMQREREREQRRGMVYRNPINPHDRWLDRVNQLREDLSEIREFPQGSVQWHMQQKLEALLQEEPQR